MANPTVYIWSQSILSWLIPSQCLLCGGTANRSYSLCPGCRADLPYTELACHLCAAPVVAGTAACGHCQRYPPAHDRLLAPLRYGPPVDRLIHAFKFRRDLAAGSVLAELLCASIEAHTPPLPDLLLPVPLHNNRLRQRGFNQSVELARRVGRLLDRPVSNRLCRRVQDTRAQSSLSAGARRRNVHDAFRLQGEVGGKKVAVIDDVVTTGSTTDELARLLRRAGAARVEIWVCARAGPQGR